MADAHKDDLFFIGWQPEMQPALRSRVRRYAYVILFLVVFSAGLLAMLQQTFGISRYAYTEVNEIEGLFRAEPYAHIKVHVPNSTHCQSFMLVDELKTAWPEAIAQQYDGQYVKLSVGSIYRGDVTLLEGNPNTSVEVIDSPGGFPMEHATDDLGEQTLIGEIVDSKCYSGAMNPGNLKTHRACATVCIRGGIPPVLLVRRKNDSPLYFFLADEQGLPVLEEVINYVAQPVAITGKLDTSCGLLMLHFDPDNIRRL